MDLFDTHFHFYGESTPLEFMNIVNSTLRIQKISEVGSVDKLFLLTVGSDYLESIRAMEFAGIVPNCHFAVGIHPHQADEYLKKPQDFSIFENNPQLKAIGELGLDYYYESSARESQKIVLKHFLDMALRLDKPAIIHLRDKDDCDDVYRDAYEILEPFTKAGGRFEIHCVSAPLKWLKLYEEIGGYFGFTGLVTFKKADSTREILHNVPLDRILLETDSPYLTPMPFRGQKNHPGYLILIANKIAEELNMSLEEVAALTTNNAIKFFNY